ncbi:Aminoacyl-tRNA hydrolase [Candidatus Roizmanbacteria bacterium]|nr:Aminoacyl-tRNA hydrolase [Candidatus Roizmanbacteria bacterium]
MLLIVGLGNPGSKYQNNRHNVGYLFVDYILESKKSKIKNQNLNSKVKIIKTDCYMNESGKFVKKLTNHYSLVTSHLLIIHDDLDIPLGKFHIQFGVGPLLHNGLESIEQHLKTKDFYRVRIGVDNRLPDKRIAGETYALQNFLSDEKKLLETEIFPKIFTQMKLDFKML